MYYRPQKWLPTLKIKSLAMSFYFYQTAHSSVAAFRLCQKPRIFSSLSVFSSRVARIGRQRKYRDLKKSNSIDLFTDPKKLISQHRCLYWSVTPAFKTSSKKVGILRYIKGVSALIRISINDGSEYALSEFDP
ncbi:hypothetical protein ABEB36_014734 [Hypothenemus hampei]|uniref:Uncharacterized protein n=1 Tax=Hypothenemus hampei TaxID=57062 RepID=A0ABD1E3P1_HYPHA